MKPGVRFYLDPTTGMPHIYKHGVTEDEVSEVLAKSGEDRLGYEGARVAIGRTQAGRYLKIIYVPEARSGRTFVITAYELRGKPLAAYKRRRQRKRKR